MEANRAFRRCALVLTASASVSLPAGPLWSDQISFSTADSWRAWTRPEGAVGIAPEGQVRPVPVRKHINAVSDAGAFGGGIRSAGSNRLDGGNIMDGDLGTAWAPNGTDPLEDWWIELDLGRVVVGEKFRLFFAEGTPPLEFFEVLFSSGEPIFTNALVPIEGTLVYDSSHNFGFNDQGQVEIDLQGRPIKAVRIVGSKKALGAKIAEVEVRSLGDNIGLGLIRRGGQIDLHTDLHQILEGAHLMVDGDLSTFWAMQPGHQAQSGQEVFNSFTFDLGAHYWVDRIRILGEPAGLPKRRQGVAGNFFWYEISASDGSLAPDGTLRWRELVSQPYLPENMRDTRTFDHEFPLQKMRYIQHFFPSSQNGRRPPVVYFGLTAEYQIYGEGFPAESWMTSPLLNLEGVKNIISVAWEGDFPPQTRLEVRTRSGDEVVETQHYFDKKGKEITQRKWEKTPKSLRGPIETAQSPGSDWSRWSDAYTLSGELFKSPSPRRYAQLQVRLFSDDPQAGPMLSALQLNFAEPMAQQTRGEVFPSRVQPGLEEEFTYYLLPIFGESSQGFDRLILEASVPVAYTGLRLGGQSLQGELQLSEQGFALDLPEAIRSQQLVELSFRSTIYQNQTRFDLFLSADHQGQQTRQRVDEGDASEAIDSESASVRLPIENDLLANFTLPSAVFTPNGDGVRDELEIQFDVLKLVVPRPVEIRLYNLAGRLLRNLSDPIGLAGPHFFSWDGRDAAGRTVPPGIYLLRARIEGDSRTQAADRIVHVVY